MEKSMVPLLIHEKGCPMGKKNSREIVMLDHIIWGKTEEEEEEERRGMEAIKSLHQAGTRLMVVASFR